MKIKSNYAYGLKIYNMGNEGTVKQKLFSDMVDLVSFTNKNEINNPSNLFRRIVEVCDKTNNKNLYKGYMVVFNRKVNKILIQGNYKIRI